MPLEKLKDILFGVQMFPNASFHGQIRKERSLYTSLTKFYLRIEARIERKIEQIWSY